MYKELKLKAVSNSEGGSSNGVLCTNENATLPINSQIKKSKSDLKLSQFA